MSYLFTSVGPGLVIGDNQELGVPSEDEATTITFRISPSNTLFPAIFKAHAAVRLPTIEQSSSVITETLLESR